MRGISIIGCGYICNGSSDETNQVGRRDFQLKTADSGADIYGLEIQGCGMKESREMLLHSDGGAPASDISSDSEKFFHSDHLHFFVAGGFCQRLQIDLGISRDDADNMSGLVSVQNKSFEYPGYVLPEAVSNVMRRQIIFVKFVRKKSEN